MSAEKVVKLNLDSVYEDILIYLGELRMHSDKTAISYEANIRQFFKLMKGKDIEYLTSEDLKTKRNDVLKYRQLIQEQEGYKNNTINQKLAAVKSLYDNLKANDYEVNPSVFKVKKLKENIDSYGHLSQTEAERMAQTVFKTESTKALAKSLMIRFAIRTSFRLDEILRVKWEDFEYDRGVYKVTTIGKGQKENTNSISDKFYNELLQLKEENKKYKTGKESYLFQLSKDAINDMMARLRKEMNISESRRVTFHSLKKVAIDWELEMTGDIKKASQQGNHSDISVTYKSYIDKTRDFTQTPGVRMDEELNLEFLDQLTLDDFKEFVKQGNYKLQSEIRNFTMNLNK